MEEWRKVGQRLHKMGRNGGPNHQPSYRELAMISVAV